MLSTLNGEAERDRQRIIDGSSIGSDEKEGEVEKLLRDAIAGQTTATLGNVVIKDDIKSTVGPFQIFANHKISYPATVTQVLIDIYREYNAAFSPLIERNREWSSDYQYCFSAEQTPINRWVQIDMVGLPYSFLDIAEGYSVKDVRAAIKKRVFEIENSLAMYQLLGNLFKEKTTGTTLFSKEFRASLDALRQKYDRPIALLAVTKEKYLDMKGAEFGKAVDEQLTDAEVKELSGFDRLLSPEDFEKHLVENGGESKYLLFVRSSDPVAKLKKPSAQIDNQLLGNPKTREIIKANAITFNIDAPDMPYDKRINDTKEYLAPMGMAMDVYSFSNIFSSDFADYLAANKANKPYKDYAGKDRLSDELQKFLVAEGVDIEPVALGERIMRAKPLKGTYGCYGHVRGTFADKEFRQNLRKGLRERTGYVIQPEMPSPVVSNSTDGLDYTYIDRVFFSTTGGDYTFMGGFRSFMPMVSVEAREGRNHGSTYTTWAEIR